MLDGLGCIEQGSAHDGTYRGMLGHVCAGSCFVCNKLTRWSASQHNCFGLIVAMQLCSKP